MTTYPAATRPTLHFIGVTTGQSSIMRVFPAWARHLGLDAAIRGIDLPLHAEPARYREAVAFLKADPLSRGALVTTHKLDLFAAARDLLDEVDPLAGADGRDELPLEARRPADRPRQGPDLLGPRHRRLPRPRPFRPHRRRGAAPRRRRLDHRDPLAPDAGARADRPARIIVTDIAPDRLAHIRAHPRHRSRRRPRRLRARRDRRPTTTACSPPSPPAASSSTPPASARTPPARR